MFAITELPPTLTNGSVTPVSGISLTTPPMITNACSVNTAREARGEELREPVGRHHRRLEAAGGDQRVDQRSAPTPPKRPSSETITA